MELVGHEPETIHGTVHYSADEEEPYDDLFETDRQVYTVSFKNDIASPPQAVYPFVARFTIIARYQN